MQKISPLRSSIEAFNKFKALRANKADKAQKTEQKAQTNPLRFVKQIQQANLV